MKNLCLHTPFFPSPPPTHLTLGGLLLRGGRSAQLQVAQQHEEEGPLSSPFSLEAKVS